MFTTDHWSSGHLPFGAEQPAAEPTTRHHRFPWAATGLFAVGHIALAAAIGQGNLQPLTAAAYIAILWLLCGLLVVASQVGANETGDHR
jgi:hypothetical protein